MASKPPLVSKNTVSSSSRGGLDEWFVSLSPRKDANAKLCAKGQIFPSHVLLLTNMPRTCGSQTIDRPDSTIVADLIRQSPVTLHHELLILFRIQASMNTHNRIRSVGGIQLLQLASNSTKLAETAITMIRKWITISQTPKETLSL